MARLIAEIRAPWETRLAERLAVSETLLYRRGNFNGSFDELLLDALGKRLDAPSRLLAGLPLGDHRAAGPAHHARGRLRPHRAHVSEHARARADGRRDPPGDGGRRRQPLPSRPLLPAGRRHAAGGRPDLHDRSAPDDGRRASRTSGSPAVRCRRRSATRWRAGRAWGRRLRARPRPRCWPRTCATSAASGSTRGPASAWWASPRRADRRSGARTHHGPRRDPAWPVDPLLGAGVAAPQSTS